MLMSLKKPGIERRPAIFGILTVMAIAFMGGAIVSFTSPHSRNEETQSSVIQVDGPDHQRIVLTRHDGIDTNWGSTSGRARIVHFGYTFCPDICPMGLSNIAESVDLVAQEGVDLKPIFVTVDPRRDTPEVLRDYVSVFHDDMLGLTGEEDQIKALATAFKAFYQVSPGREDDEYYLMDHTSYVFLVDKSGALLDYFPGSTEPKQLAQKVIEALGKS